MVDSPKLDKRILPSLTEQQIETLINHVESLRDKCIISLLADSGMRVSELASIQMKDIDWSTKTITVIGKGNKQRRAPFTSRTAKEYHTKTTRPHQMWATDASYFRVVGWGYYYLVTVMDDYSRFILGWKLQKDMSANSLIEVVQKAVDATGMTDVPVEDRTKLLSDNGAGYVSRAFRNYLNLVGIGHILAAPFHPQTNGKVERYQQSLKREVNQLPYDLPNQLDKAIADFVDYYNYRRYHKALGNVTPADVLYGRREEILQRRKEVQIQTINRRRDYNQGLRELVNAA
jgi:hypothetical protein